MIGLTLRLSLLLTAAIALTAMAVGGAYWLAREPADFRPSLPLPEQVSAIVAALELLPAAQRGVMQQALSSDGLSVSLLPAPADDSARPARELPAFSWMVSRYSIALGDRAVRAELVDAPDGLRLRLRTALRDGTPLSVEMRGDALRRLRSGQILVLLALALLVTAGIAAWGLRRQIRPIEQLANAMDRHGTPDARPLPAPGGAPEVRRLHEAFARFSQRIEQLIDDRSRLFAAISHDLGTYLTRLRLRIDLIGDESQRRRAEQDIEHMAALLRDLLGIARLRAAPLASSAVLDFTALLADELEALSLRQEVRAIRRRHWPEQPLLIQGNAALLRRLLANLLDNAAKHGGGLIEVALAEERGELLLSIEDRGPGIPEAELGQVLEPFYRGDAARNLDRPGSGLGLAIVADAVRQHRGHIELGNRQGGGLSVRLRLPIAPADRSGQTG